MSELIKTIDTLIDRLASDIALMSNSSGLPDTKSAVDLKKIRALDGLKSIFHHSGIFQQIESLEQQLKQQWVSVDDKPPKNHSHFIAWVNSPNCCFRCDDDIVISYTSTKVDITHWMPLPKPPAK